MVRQDGILKFQELGIARFWTNSKIPKIKFKKSEYVCVHLIFCNFCP